MSEKLLALKSELQQRADATLDVCALWLACDGFTAKTDERTGMHILGHTTRSKFTAEDVAELREALIWAVERKLREGAGL